MVRLDRIYTGVGDGGTTMLADGTRVSKSHERVEAYGSVDEANASIGVAASVLSSTPVPGVEVARELAAIQNDLFDLGADLSKPVGEAEPEDGALRVNSSSTEKLEGLIDVFNEDLEALDSFVLPGGSPASAQLHVARTVVRRAERRVASLIESEPDATNPETLVYLNRLSDLLFVLARVANKTAGDVKWRPGGESPSS